MSRRRRLVRLGCLVLLSTRSTALNSTRTSSVYSSSDTTTVSLASSASLDTGAVSFGTSSSVTTTGLGDYVAQGLGVSAASTSVEDGAAQSTTSASSQSDTLTTIYKTVTKIATSSSKLSGTNGNTTTAFTTGSGTISASTVDATQQLNLTAGTVCADLSCAITCDRLWQTWTTGSQRFYDSYVTQHGNFTTTSTRISFASGLAWSPIYPSAPAVYTLCDGVPRVDAKVSTSWYNSTGSSTLTDTITTIDATFSIAPPACSVNPAMCLDLAADYASASSSYNPLCKLPPGYSFQGLGSLTEDDEFFGCNLVGGPVRLLYWPVTTVGGLCANSTSIINATRTGVGPNTVTFDGTVLTSPTVYLSFETLYAITTNNEYWNDSYTSTLGPTFANILLPEAPASISTYCGTSTGIYGLPGANLPQIEGAVPLDYARLLQPVQLTDYNCAAAADNQLASGNGTIWNNYNPTLLFPTDVVKVATAWRNCSAGVWDWLLFDPPISLTTVASEAGVSIVRTTMSTQAIATSQTAQPAGSITAIPAQTTSSTTIEQTPYASSSSSSAALQSTAKSSSDVVDPVTAPESHGSAASSRLDPSSSASSQSLETDSTLASHSEVSTTSGNSASTHTISSTLEDSSHTQTVSSALEVSSHIYTASSTLEDSSHTHTASSVLTVPSTATSGETADASKTASSSTSRNAAGVLASLLASTSSGQPQQQPTGTDSHTTPGSAFSSSPSGAATEEPVVLTVPISSSNYVTTAAGQTLTILGGISQPAAVVESSTISKGKAVTVSSVVISVGDSGVIVSHASTDVSPASHLITAGSLTLTAASGPSSVAAVVIDSVTISSGGKALVSGGQTLSVGSPGAVVIAASGSTTTALLQATQSVSAQVEFTAGSSTLTASRDPNQSGAVAIGSTLLSVEGAAATISGQTVSVDSEGLVIASGSSTNTVFFTAKTASAVLVTGSGESSSLSGLPVLTQDDHTTSLGSSELPGSATITSTSDGQQASTTSSGGSLEPLATSATTADSTSAPTYTSGAVGGRVFDRPSLILSLAFLLVWLTT